MIDTAPSPDDLRNAAACLRDAAADYHEEVGITSITQAYDKVADMLESLIPLAEHLAKMEEAGVDPSVVLPAFLRQLGG